jgi:hypothetical protein
MDIDAIRSSLGALADGVPIGADAAGNVILSPPINVTRAQSTLTAFSGQTIVYGGLIQKTRQQFSRRVPYISSIPILGRLFRYDQETEIRSELLVIMTPMVISGDEDLEYVKQEESSRMSYCIADVVEMHGDVGLSGGYGLWGPAVGPMIYPDVTPTIDDIEMMHRGIDLNSGAMEMGPYGNSAMEPATIEGPYSRDVYTPGEYGNEPMEYTPSPMPQMQFNPNVPVPQGDGSGYVPQGGRGPAVQGVIEPAYPVQPIGHVRQVQHAVPAGQAKPRRTPRP